MSGFENNYDFIALGISLLVLITYHIIYVIEVYFEKNEVFNLWINTRITTLWIDRYFKSNNCDEIGDAIHAIRNVLLVAIFLGGYALQSTYSMIFSMPIYASFIPFQTNTYSISMGIGNVILVTCLVSSFVCWIQVLRNCLHLGFILDGWNGTIIPFEMDNNNNNILNSSEDMIINTSEPIIDEKELQERKEYYKLYANFIARNIIVYISFAFRFLYLSIPFAFFNLGPLALIISSIIIIILEIIWDYQFI